MQALRPGLDRWPHLTRAQRRTCQGFALRADRRSPLTCSPPGAPLADAPPTYREPLPASIGDLLLLVGRILIGQIFVVSGFWKLLGLSAFGASLAARGVPAPETMAVLGAAAEFFGGLALLVG